MKTPNISIAFQNEPSIDDSLALNELRDSILESEIPVEAKVKPSPKGVKDGGLTLGLAIAGITLSALSTLVSAISLWGSKRNYSISFKSGDTTFSANNLKAHEARAIAKTLHDKSAASDIQILVSHG